MAGKYLAVVAGWLVLASGLTAADGGLDGNWKLSIFDQGQFRPLWLLKLEAKNGALSGSVLATAEDMPASSVDNVKLTAEAFQLKIKMQGQPFSFEAKVNKEDATKKILGSMMLGNQLVPASLEKTTVKNLDPYELDKESLTKATGGPEVLVNAVNLLAQAAKRKAKPEEVRSWADKAFKSAEPFGPRMQRNVALQIAEGMVDAEGLGPVALEYARKAERLLDPKDKPFVQRRVLEALVAALTKADKADEAKEVEARLKKIELVQRETYPGRQGKSDRVVVVELFTGAQCPPCVAADLAFDALTKTFKPSEVILLQYHLHIPGPDPLTNPDTVARQDYYGRAIPGTPTIFFNGKSGPLLAGLSAMAQDRYDEAYGALTPFLEKPAKGKLTLTADQKGDKIDINAEVVDLDQPGEQKKLRLALIEEEVKYTGGNRLPTHHHVVRAFPGGIDGLAVRDKSAKKTVTVDLGKLRKDWIKYLDEFAEKSDVPFPNKNRPLNFKNLRVVAFVQDDDTKEILQAAQVALPTKE